MRKEQFTVSPDLLATNGQRAANFLIDFVMRFFIMSGIYLIAAVIMVSNGYSLKDVQLLPENLSEITRYSIALVINLLYYNFFELLFSSTIAKFITNTIVVNEFGEKADANSVLMRSICREIPLEFLTFLGTPCLGWHDRLSSTYVVKKDLLEISKKQFYTFTESKAE